MSHHSNAGKIGAHSKWASTPDRSAATAPARKAFKDRFLNEAKMKFPDATPEQLAQLAESSRRAFYARLALLSAAARSRKARQKKAA